MDHVSEVLGDIKVLINAYDAVCHFILDLLLILVKSLLNLDEGLQRDVGIDVVGLCSIVIHEINVLIIVLEDLLVLLKYGFFCEFVAHYALKLERADHVKGCRAITGRMRVLHIVNWDH